MGSSVMKKMVVGLMSVACVGSLVFGNVSDVSAKELMKGTMHVAKKGDLPKRAKLDKFSVQSNNFVGKSFLYAEFYNDFTVHTVRRGMDLYKCTEPKKGKTQKCNFHGIMGQDNGKSKFPNVGWATYTFLDEGYYMVRVQKSTTYAPIGYSLHSEFTPIFHYKKYGMFQ